MIFLFGRRLILLRLPVMTMDMPDRRRIIGYDINFLVATQRGFSSSSVTSGYDAGYDYYFWYEV